MRVAEVPSIEALIVSFNTKEALRETLVSLLDHRPPAHIAALRVSVFDNASADGSPEMVAQQFGDVNLIRSEVNVGFAQANNRLARDSSADYLLLLNSDVIFTQDVITPLLRVLESDTRAIVAGPRLVHPGGEVQLSAQRLPTLSYEFARVMRGRRLGRAMEPLFASRRRVDLVHEPTLTNERIEPRTPEFLWATCWMIRRADVAADGLFDEAFTLYDEDLDYCRRAQQRGRSLRYVSTAELVHLGGTSSTTSAAKQRLMTRGRRRYYRRHHGIFAAFVYASGVPVVNKLAGLVELIPRPRRRATPLR